MKNCTLQKLKEGIALGSSSVLIPWKTSFNKLMDYGMPESRQHVGKEQVIWKNEQLFGVTVDLRVIFEPGFFCHRKKLRNVSAYISETAFEKIRQNITDELSVPGNFRKLNDVEFTYSWKVANCEIVLSHIDRFGSFFRLDIRRITSISGLLQAFGPHQNGLFPCKPKNSSAPVLFMFSGQKLAQPIVISTV